MKLEYRNGVRISKYAHELSPLEAAMQQYEENIAEQEKLANTHYDKSVDPKKEEARKSALEYLALERQRLAAFADVHDQLRDYRNLESKALSKDKKTAMKARDAMLTEDHHPTDELEKYMRAEGMPKPSSLHTAHHICPGSGSIFDRDAKTLRAYRIRCIDILRYILKTFKEKDQTRGCI